MIQTNRKAGMITLDDSLYELYAAGLVEADVALSYAQDYQYLSRKII